MINGGFLVIHKSEGGRQYLDIIDAATGISKNNITLPGEVNTLLTPPMVMGDQVSFTCLYKNGSRWGYVYKVPSGILVNQIQG